MTLLTVFNEFRSVLLLIASCLISACSGESLPVVIIAIQGQQGIKTVCAEVAVTAKQQQKGLMGRTHIADGTGMLFIYKKDTLLRFWMKNTPYPLSIAFIDSNGKIREIRNMQPYSLEIVSSVHSVRYALEVPQGYFEKHRISAGAVLTSQSLDAIQNYLQ